MKIWVDLTNSPHVNFFAPIIEELGQKHEFVLTCRPLANTIELLNLNRLPHQVIGSHYGKSSIRKGFGFLIRVGQLYRYLRGKSIEAAISHSSFYSPVVSRLLGVRCIYLNDNEFAEGNRISFLCADTIMVPEFLDTEKVLRQGGGLEKIVKYPGVKEGVYLWRRRGCREGNGKGGRKVIYVRPEPWTAQYYQGSRNFLDDLLPALGERFEVFVLPRGKVQEAHYRQARFAGIHVPESSLELEEIAAGCDLFIGAGGTMTREAAILGIPTISVYQDELLDVDKFLIREGVLLHRRDPDFAFVTEFMEKMSRKPPHRHLLEKGEKAFRLIIDTLLEENRG